jgi:hypothetical protein
VPPARFLLAAKRLLGRQLKLDNDGTGGKRDLGVALPIERRLVLRAAVLNLVRARSNELERYATELDQPIGFIYYEDGNSTEVAEVIGGREDSRPAPTAFARPHEGPFEIYRLEELGELEPNERVGLATHRVSQQPRSDDPVSRRSMTLLNALFGSTPLKDASPYVSTPMNSRAVWTRRSIRVSMTPERCTRAVSSATVPRRLQPCRTRFS